MKEFGSDFHSMSGFQSKRTHLDDIYKDAVYLADGRMCLLSLIEHNGWKRIWLPEYFCYEVIDTIKTLSGIEIKYYLDYPGYDDTAGIGKIDFREGDVLFRVNYFGMRDKRSEAAIPVPVIEDHTHDLFGHWALYSDADWCIASLRKTLPIAEGGMMWSPKGLDLTAYAASSSDDNEVMMAKRWSAMDMKSAYLSGEDVDKEAFRSLYMETEEWFDSAPVSGIDSRSMETIRSLDINAWYNAKRKNLEAIGGILSNELCAEDESCNLFSFVLRTNNRQEVRKSLIDSKVYSAILWNVPDTVSTEVKKFSQSMLSIHCDGRYSVEDMAEIASRTKIAL